MGGILSSEISLMADDDVGIPMQTQPQPSPEIDVRSILPPDWDLKTDVLLIVGEGASIIATPFVKFGLKRVIAMFPRPLPIEQAVAGVTVVSSRGELNRALHLIGHDSANRFALLRTPDCSIPHDETDALHKLTSTLLKRKQANEHTHDHLAPLWAANGVRNLRHLGRHLMVTDLKGQFQGVPLIIVGAGPSLSKNINLLKQAQGKAIIICVARALTSLQQAGVWPDFAISLDAYDVKSHFRNIELDRITGLILSSTSHPNLFDFAVDTRLISFSANTVAEGWMFDDTDGVVEMPSGGSVSCAAMSVGLHWGCNPIMVVGQDLSFDSGQFYHDAGTDGDAKAHYDERSNTWSLNGYSDDLAHTLKDQVETTGLTFSGAVVPGYYGGSVQTNTAFASFRTWFELTALDEAGRTTMFNCTEGGAHIGGMQHIDLKQAIDSLAQRAVNPRKLLDIACEKTPLTERHERMTRKSDDIRSNVENAIQHARTAIQLIEKTKRNPNQINALQAVESSLSAALKKAFVINLLAQDEIRNAIAKGQSAKSMHESLDATKQLYQVIIQHGEKLRRNQ